MIFRSEVVTLEHGPRANGGGATFYQHDGDLLGAYDTGVIAYEGVPPIVVEDKPRGAVPSPVAPVVELAPTAAPVPGGGVVVGQPIGSSLPGPVTAAATPTAAPQPVAAPLAQPVVLSAPAPALRADGSAAVPGDSASLRFVPAPWLWWIGAGVAFLFVFVFFRRRGR